ncbi:MAG: DUF4159 domain-containing protein [Bacteroidetes bacterium]|nr:MAG: DUF4159 domain-containing protein [Bacteroidota bacterium]
MKKWSVLLIVLVLSSFAPQKGLQIARLKYKGGGDWYANKTSLPNLIAYANKALGLAIEKEEAVVEPASADLFNYPFVHMTGHGTFTLSEDEAANLRKYLMGGGFLHIDDNYGLDPFVRPQMKKVFPELDFVELPFTHAIYNQKYKFPNGLPKVHEHDNKPAQGFGLVYKGRVVCFYSYESDLGNGWEDAGTYSDSPQVREKALQMGTNLLMYAFTATAGS